MDQLEYAYNVFLKHLKISKKKDTSLVILELGPGDSLLTAIFSFAHNASASYLVDVEDYANKDLDVYSGAIDFLKKKGFNFKFAGKYFRNIDEMLDQFSASYLTCGLDSLRQIPNNSVDLIFSQAVLEHIPKSEFYETFIEIRRILKRGGICSHVIDLRDHLEHGLNNLRFSERFWESKFIRKSGFYTNRLRKTEMLEYFKIAGFRVTVLNVENWEELPIKRSQLASEFQNISDEELCISTFSIKLEPIS